MPSDASFQNAKCRVAILISGRGSNMTALIEAAKRPGYPAQIVLVVSNIADAVGITKAKSEGIATEVVESRSFAGGRDAYDLALNAKLTSAKIDLVCLAGFMRLLTPRFVEQWQGRMINIHPSLLPAYRGLHTHARALADGVKTHGASVHFVVPEVDAGPIILQGPVDVHDGDTAETLAARVREVEHRIYPEALKLVASGKVTIDDATKSPI